MRTDSFTSSEWVDGSELTGSVADGATLLSKAITKSGWYLLGFINSCDVAFAYRVRQLDTDGSTVLHSTMLQAAAGNDPELWPSPVQLRSGQTVKVLLNGGITTTKGVQITLFLQLLVPEP